MGDILSTQKDLNGAIAPLGTRLDTIEANPVLTLVGCNNEAFPTNSKLPTCDQMTAADSALAARVGLLENAQSPEKAPLAIWFVLDGASEPELSTPNTTKITFQGAGVGWGGGSGDNEVVVDIPTTLPYAFGGGVSLGSLSGTLLNSGLASQGASKIDSTPYKTIAFTAPTSGVYALTYSLSILAQGAVGDHAVNAGTRVIYAIDNSSAWRELTGTTFTHPIKTNTSNQLVLTAATRLAAYVYLTAGAHTITLAARSEVREGPTTHTITVSGSMAADIVDPVLSNRPII